MTRVRLHLMTVGRCRHPACMATGRLGLGQKTFPALVARITHPSRGTILFDTGYGDAVARSRDPVGRLYRRVLPYRLEPGEACIHQLAAAGLEASDVHAVVLSHLHPDHAGGLADFPRVPILLSRRAYEGRAPAGFPARLAGALIRDLFPEDLGARARFFEDAPACSGADDDFSAGADLFGDGSLLAVPLPGHAPGQFGLRLRTETDRDVLLCADGVWLSVQFRDLLEPMAPARLILDDYPAYLRTIRRLHAFAKARPETLIVPSHCEATIAAATLALG